MIMDTVAHHTCLIWYTFTPLQTPGQAVPSGRLEMEEKVIQPPVLLYFHGHQRPGRHNSLMTRHMDNKQTQLSQMSHVTELPITHLGAAFITSTPAPPQGSPGLTSRCALRMQKPGYALKGEHPWKCEKQKHTAHPHL